MDETPETLENKFRAIAQRTHTEKPKPADVKAFRAFLEAHPKFWTRLGQLSLQARYGLIDEMRAPTVTKESLQVGIDELERTLRRKEDSTLERLLIEQVVLCWLRLNYAELLYSAKHRDSISLDASAYWEKRLTAAQARYLKAIETLARVRRLNVPAQQINIAEKQVNIAQGPQANVQPTAIDTARA